MNILVAFLLTACAGAQEPVQSSAAGEPPALAEQAGKSAELRRFYHGLTADERGEFNRAFDIYQRHVARRLSQGWVYHNNQKVNDSITALHIPDEVVALSLHDVERVELPRDMQRLSALMNKTRNEPEERMARQLAERIEALQRDKRRVWGRCGDWSDEIQGRLSDETWSAIEIGHTEVVTNKWLHPIAGASSEHASVRVCGKTSRLCAVFDPWRAGKAAVLGAEEWRDGGPLKVCMATAQGERAAFCAGR